MKRKKALFSFNTEKLGDGVTGVCIRCVLKRNRTNYTFIYREEFILKELGHEMMMRLKSVKQACRLETREELALRC